MFRSLLFLGASLGVMIIGGIVMLPALLFARRLASRTPSWFAGIQLFLLESIAGLALEVRGRKNLPAGAALIAVKHQSALDAYALVRLFPDACFVLKQEILDVPVRRLVHRGHGCHCHRPQRRHRLSEADHDECQEGR